jgi:hypothetical protein
MAFGTKWQDQDHYDRTKNNFSYIQYRFDIFLNILLFHLYRARHNLIKKKPKVMKKLIGATFLILLLQACKKDVGKGPGTSIYLHSVLPNLRGSLSTDEFSRQDTSKAYLTEPGKAKYYTLRLPFVGKPIAEDFMLLRTDANGNILQGQVVHLENTGHSLSRSI